MKKILHFFLDKSLLPFLIIGGTNTIITQVGEQLLLGPLGYWGASALMYFLCSIASVFLNRKYSFHSTAPLLQSAIRFTVLVCACYVLSHGLSQWIIPWGLELVFGTAPSWAERLTLLGAQVIFTLLNYVGQRLWAFKE